MSSLRSWRGRSRSALGGEQFLYKTVRPVRRGRSGQPSGHAKRSPGVAPGLGWSRSARAARRPTIAGQSLPPPAGPADTQPLRMALRRGRRRRRPSWPLQQGLQNALWTLGGRLRWCAATIDLGCHPRIAQQPWPAALNDNYCRPGGPLQPPLQLHQSRPEP